MFVELDLARQLEQTEGNACLDFARARKQLQPESSVAWDFGHGAIAVFDGADSPLTQSFGLGVMEPRDHEASLDFMEDFFFSRQVPAHHEVSPFAGVAVMESLCRRGYKPVEMSSVLYQTAQKGEPASSPGVHVHCIHSGEAELWGQTSADAWSGEHPEFREFLLDMGRLSTNRERTYCFLGTLHGKPAATAILYVHDGVALFAGSATLPAMRRNGLQAALLSARKQLACELGCKLFMMVAEPGSGSQRNAERNGFRIAYTRMKWQLSPPAV